MLFFVSQVEAWAPKPPLALVPHSLAVTVETAVTVTVVTVVTAVTVETAE